MAEKKKARKPAAELTVTVHLTVPVKLANRLDGMWRDLKAQKPYSFISRSGFYCHCLGGFIELFDDPERQPTLPAVVRRRIRPAAPDAHAQQD